MVLHIADIYPSNRIDWQPVECIVGIFDSFHAFIGEQMYRGRSHRELARNGIFFFDMSYIEPKMISAGWGLVMALPLPFFDSKDWALPAAAETSESYRSRLFQDIQKSLKYSIATKTVRLTLFMPTEVFVDFFSDEQIRSTTTMFICKSESCLDFLDDIR